MWNTGKRQDANSTVMTAVKYANIFIVILLLCHIGGF